MTNGLGGTLAKQAEEEEKRQREAIEAEATIIMLGNGEVSLIEYFKKAYSLLHCGDVEILKGIIYASCLQSSTTSKGLHPTLNGNKGSGKSSAAKAALWLLPQGKVFDKSLSPKALLYLKAKEKSVFYIDDFVWNGELVSLLKRATSSFQNITQHVTVGTTSVGTGKNKTQVMGAQTLTMNKRMVFISSAVQSEGDDQLVDRQLLIGAGSCSAEAYTKWEMTRRIQAREELPLTHEVLVCRAIMGIIHNKEFRVTFHKELDFAFYNDRRLMNQLMDLIEASAILHHMQRECNTDSNGITHTLTQDEDLSRALEFSMFRQSSSELIGRLTIAEAKLDAEVMQALSKGDFIEGVFPKTQDGVLIGASVSEQAFAIIHDTSVNAVRKLLYGRGGNQNHIVSGLCEKTKWYTPSTTKVTHENCIYVTVHKTIGYTTDITNATRNYAFWKP